ncbi:MAG: hypothetical protein V9F04_13965 [Dermatophilaceae bacterium]
MLRPFWAALASACTPPGIAHGRGAIPHALVVRRRRHGGVSPTSRRRCTSSARRQRASSRDNAQMLVVHGHGDSTSTTAVRVAKRRAVARRPRRG